MNLSGKTILPSLLFRRRTEPGKSTETPQEASTTRESRLLRVCQTDEFAEEALWIARARAGQVEAFDWLMSRYRDRAVRLAAHVLRRPAEAEDLVQEAFLRAFSQIRDFRGEAAFYTWLYRIVIRLSLNRMRHPDWRLEYETNSPHNVAEPESAVLESEQSETRLLIEVLLDRLTPPLRAALVLRELEGLDYDEIAETLQIPVGTVRSRLNAARSQFRTLWIRAMEEVNHV